MARRSVRRRTTRSNSYRPARRTRAAPRYSRAAPRRRTSGRRVGSGAARTIKLVIQTTSSPVADTGLPLGMKPAPAAKVAKF